MTENHRDETTTIRDFELVPDDPYRALAAAGITHASTAKEVHLAGMQLQRAGALDERANQAWKELRNPERRLVLDLTSIALPPTRSGAIPEPPLELGELVPLSLDVLADALELPPELAGLATLPPREPPAPPLQGWELLGEALSELRSPTLDLGPPPALTDDEPVLDSPQEP
jgi:hypothetical protein